MKPVMAPAAPDLSFGPGREFAQLGDLGMISRRIVWQRQSGRIEDSAFHAEAFQELRSLA